MLAIIVLFTFSGNKIDFYFNVQKPFFTATFALLGTVLALYLAFKKILKK
jgi:predicted membrane chloride channel (bestrophin family)